MIHRFSSRFWMLTAMIVAAAAMRILPHPPNFSPVTAMALFGGAHFASKRQAFLMPLAVMFLSDAVLELMFGWGFHDQMLSVYLSFAAIVGIGLLLRERCSPLTIGLSAVSASTLFFVTTNFTVWLSSGMYPKSIAGLVSCYIAAIPFYGASLTGDLFYTAILFSLAAYFAKKYSLVLAKA